MRIFDEHSKEATNRIVLILTVSEAGELRDKTKQLLARRMALDHEHINDSEYKKEITVSIYDTQPISGYAPRYQTLILEDA